MQRWHQTKESKQKRGSSKHGCNKQQTKIKNKNNLLNDYEMAIFCTKWKKSEASTDFSKATNFSMAQWGHVEEMWLLLLLLLLSSW